MLINAHAITVQYQNEGICCGEFLSIGISYGDSLSPLPFSIGKNVKKLKKI